MNRITILGMGAMGSRMAGLLLKSGYAVTVWNRSIEKTIPLVVAGATVAATPRAAVEECDLVICMVRDDEASQQIWLDPDRGALLGLPKNAIAIESSTLTVAWAQDLGQKCAAQGIPFLDAPVAGSRPQAEAAQLIYFVGGDSATLDQAMPVLKSMGGAIHHCGATGSGAAIKLMVNALLSIQVAALSELIGLMRPCGLDEAQAIHILTATPVCSPAAKAAAAGILARNFTPLFPIELVEKDLAYVLGTAQAQGVLMPLAEATQSIFAQALAKGHGAANITGVAQLYLD